MPIALSFSGWKDSECPFRFNALRIAKTYKEPETDAMIVGAAFAKLTDRYRKHCFIAHNQCDTEALLKIAGEIRGTLAADQSDAFGEIVERFKDSEFAVIPPAEHVSWWSTEYQVAYDADLHPILHPDAWFDKGAAFRAVADFVYRSGPDLYVIDDKTGRGTPDPWQLKIYAALLPRAIGCSPDRVVCIFNNILGKKEVIEFFPADLYDVDEKLKARMAEINAWTEFPARACDACKWCSVPGCSIRQDVATALETHPKTPILKIPDSITMPLEADHALLFVLFAESIVDQVKDLLRAYVESNGPVTAGGKIAKLKPSESWKATHVEKIVKTLAAYGVPVNQIWDSLSITESAIEKIMKKNKLQDRLAMILQLGERKNYKPRFSITNHQVDRM